MFAVVSLLMDSHGVGAAGPPASLPGQILEVTATPSHVSLTAREAPLADVLKAIGQQAGVKIVLYRDFNTPVTATLANVPLDEAIQRLSRWHSVVLIYDPSARRPDDAALKEVWVMSAPAEPRSSSPGTNRGVSPGVAQSEAGRRQGRGLPATDGREQAPPVGSPQLATSPEPPPASNLRSQGSDPPLALALKRELSDSGTQVIDTLVRRWGADGAVKILREAATRDPDDEIRRGAIKALASLGSRNAVEAIRGTLRDPHAGVRKDAIEALRQMGQSR
jgi:HEAT repeat protein